MFNLDAMSAYLYSLNSKLKWEARNNESEALSTHARAQFVSTLMTDEVAHEALILLQSVKNTSLFFTEFKVVQSREYPPFCRVICNIANKAKLGAGIQSADEAQSSDETEPNLEQQSKRKKSTQAECPPPHYNKNTDQILHFLHDYFSVYPQQGDFQAPKWELSVKQPAQFWIVLKAPSSGYAITQRESDEIRACNEFVYCTWASQNYPFSPLMKELTRQGIQIERHKSGDIYQWKASFMQKLYELSLDYEADRNRSNIAAAAFSQAGSSFRLPTLVGSRLGFFLSGPDARQLAAVNKATWDASKQKTIQHQV